MTREEQLAVIAAADKADADYRVARKKERRRKIRRLLRFLHLKRRPTIAYIGCPGSEAVIPLGSLSKYAAHHQKARLTLIVEDD